MHIERGGKTLTGREHREWRVGMVSNVNGRGCEIIRFGKRTDARVLVRWLEECDKYDSRMLPGNVGKGKTQWVGLYQIEPECWVPPTDEELS